MVRVERRVGVVGVVGVVVVGVAEVNRAVVAMAAVEVGTNLNEY